MGPVSASLPRGGLPLRSSCLCQLLLAPGNFCYLAIGFGTERGTPPPPFSLVAWCATPGLLETRNLFSSLLLLRGCLFTTTNFWQSMDRASVLGMKVGPCPTYLLRMTCTSRVPILRMSASKRSRANSCLALLCLAYALPCLALPCLAWLA